MRKKLVTIWYQRTLRRYNGTTYEPLFFQNQKDERTGLSAGVYIHPNGREEYVAVHNGEKNEKPPKGEAEFRDLCILDDFNYLPPPDSDAQNVVLTDDQLMDVLRQTARREALEETGIDLKDNTLLPVGNYTYQTIGSSPRTYYLFRTEDSRTFEELKTNFIANAEAQDLVLRDAADDDHRDCRFDHLLINRRR